MFSLLWLAVDPSANQRGGMSATVLNLTRLGILGVVFRVSPFAKLNPFMRGSVMRQGVCLIV